MSVHLSPTPVLNCFEHVEIHGAGVCCSIDHILGVSCSHGQACRRRWKGEGKAKGSPKRVPRAKAPMTMKSVLKASRAGMPRRARC